MDAIVMVKGEAVDNLFKALGAPIPDGVHTVRIAVDAGDLKVKINEGAWTHGLGAAWAGR